MKVRLLAGTYYRREGGVLTRYKAGDVFEASPAEFARLEAKEQIFVRKPKEEVAEESAPVPEPITIPEPEPEEIPDNEEVELSDDELLDKYVERSGSWYTFADGTRIQGRLNAIKAARELNG